jgi:beta-lactamase class A
VYSDPVKKIQEEMYQQLLVLREGILQSLEASLATATGGAQAAPVVQARPVAAGTSSEVQEELAKLREENTKLKYRVGFLVKTLDEVERKK